MNRGFCYFIAGLTAKFYLFVIFLLMINGYYSFSFNIPASTASFLSF